MVNTERDRRYRRTFTCHYTGLVSQFAFRRLTAAERERINEHLRDREGRGPITDAKRGDLLDGALEKVFRDARSSDAGPVFEYRPLWTHEECQSSGGYFPEYHTWVKKTILEVEFGAKDKRPFVPYVTNFEHWLGHLGRNVYRAGPALPMMIRRRGTSRGYRPRTRRTRVSSGSRGDPPHEPEPALAGARSGP